MKMDRDNEYLTLEFLTVKLVPHLCFENLKIFLAVITDGVIATVL